MEAVSQEGDIEIGSTGQSRAAYDLRRGYQNMETKTESGGGGVRGW